jgi:hypothetical protein
VQPACYTMGTASNQRSWYFDLKLRLVTLSRVVSSLAPELDHS